ncbi:hypothetical protein [Cognatitamlana onchidii]
MKSSTGNSFTWDGSFKGNPLPTGDYWLSFSANEF